MAHSMEVIGEYRVSWKEEVMPAEPDWIEGLGVRADDAVYDWESAMAVVYTGSTGRPCVACLCGNEVAMREVRFRRIGESHFDVREAVIGHKTDDPVPDGASPVRFNWRSHDDIRPVR